MMQPMHVHVPNSTKFSLEFNIRHFPNGKFVKFKLPILLYLEESLNDRLYYD